MPDNVPLNRAVFMPVQSFILTTSNALLVGMLAIPVWLAWRYLQQATLWWMMVGYMLAGLMYGFAPFAQGVVFPDANLSAAIFTPLFGSAFVTAMLHLVGVAEPTRTRWAWAGFAFLAGGYALTLPFGVPTFVRAVLLGIAFMACAALCFVHSRREPQVGFALVGLSLLTFPVALVLIATSSLPDRLQLASVEMPFVTLGLSVMTVVALRARKSHNQTMARNMQLEHELSAMTEEVGRVSASRETEAMNASRLVDGFNRTVAHDLKGAISAVLAGTQYTRQLLQQGEGDKAIEFLPKVEQQAHGAIERIAAMQRLAQTASLPLDLREVGLEDIAQSALSEVKRQQPGQKLEVPIYLMPLPVVVCDPGLMRVFFINLLSNAVKFSQGVSDPTVHIGALQDDPSGEPIFFIRDTGVGFDPAKAPELFTPFGRRDPSNKGMGVGVSVASNIIERHGGRLWVESDVGEGATFFFTLGNLTLPKARVQAGQAETATRAAA